MMNDFTCEKCQKTFTKGWTKEEAEKEYSVAPWNVRGDDRGLICDDCFQEFKEWFSKLTPEDHRRIRDE
jgi:hypothetical protein